MNWYITVLYIEKISRFSRCHFATYEVIFWNTHTHTHTHTHTLKTNWIHIKHKICYFAIQWNDKCHPSHLIHIYLYATHIFSIDLFFLVSFPIVRWFVDQWNSIFMLDNPILYTLHVKPDKTFYHGSMSWHIIIIVIFYIVPICRPQNGWMDK